MEVEARKLLTSLVTLGGSDKKITDLFIGTLEGKPRKLLTSLGTPEVRGQKTTDPSQETLGGGGPEATHLSRNSWRYRP